MQRDLSAAEFRQFRDLIYQAAGIRYPDEKLALLSNRIRRRLQPTGVSSYARYLQRIQSPGQQAEMQQFLDAITTNETYFFRCARHWDLFRKWVREQASKPQTRRNGLRIWSAAASNGSEAYTAAIVLHQELGDHFGGVKIEIVGTDLSQAVLSEARAASYRPYALTQVPATVRLRYFKPGGNDLQRFDPELAALVRFTQHNLLQPMRGPLFDFVLVRNVMIYFDQTAKETALQHLHNAMQPGALLLVGESESLLNVRHALRYLEPCLFQKPEPGRVRS